MKITRQALDLGLIIHTGWTLGADVANQCGVNVVDYFSADGSYLGADENGLAPTFEAVGTTFELEMRDDQCRHTVSIESASIEDAKSQAKAATIEWIEGGDWGINGASVSANWSLAQDGEEVADGSVTVDIPADEDSLVPSTECGDSVDDHDWTSEGCGGCKENPGVWSLGGTKMLFKTRCQCCGLIRIEKTVGSQCNPGEHDTVEFELP